MFRPSSESTEIFELRLTERERRLIAEKTFAPPDLTDLLRFGIRDGDFNVYRLSFDDLEELLGYIAAEANHTNSKKLQKQLDVIFDRIEKLLSESQPEPAPSNMPPGLATAIAELMASREFQSLDEVNRALENLNRAYNTTGRPELNGLSPEQVHKLIYSDWVAGAGPMRLSSGLSFDELKHARILIQARFVLSEVLANNGVRATAAGNFNRAFVADMLERGIWGRDDKESLARYYRVVNEDNVWELHVLRIVLKMAKLIRLERGRFVTTKRGRDLLDEGRAGALFRELFIAYFGKFNLDYLTRTREMPAIQHFCPYSFYAVQKTLKDWSKAEAVAQKLFLPPLYPEIEAAILSGGGRFFASTHILDPLEKFGLVIRREVEGKYEKVPESEYKKSTLFDKVFQFDFGPPNSG